MTDKFENLKSEVSNCTKCLLSSTRNKVVFGGGNPDLKRPAWEDFKKVVLKYRELVDPDHYSEHV